jgi:hypothetical protein
MIDPELETPVQVVNRHVEAMARRDLDAFLAECAGTVRLLSTDGVTQLDGKTAFRDTYANVFDANPNLKIELIDRINVGSWVFDEHLSTGFADGRQVHAVRVYLVEHGRIQSIQVYT